MVDHKAIVRRTLFAIAGGALLSVVACLHFVNGSLRWSLGELAVALGIFWVVNFVLILAISVRATARFRDPGLTLFQMLWATGCILLLANVVEDGRELLLLLHLLAMIFGAFRLRLRQFLLVTAIASSGYCMVIISLVAREPLVFEPFQDLVTWGVYTTVMVAFSVLGADISQLRQTLRQRNAELREARDLAEAADQAKGEFLGMLSHEIRTPLNALIGIPDVLERVNLDDEERHYIASSRRASDHLLSLVGSMLDLSRLEGGDVKLEAVRFEPAQLCDEIATLMTYNASERGLTFECDVADGLPDHLVGDPARIRDVLIQLLSNAIKFTRKGRVRLQVRSVPAGSAESARLQFTVEDTGIGIAADKLKTVFGPFSLVDGSITRENGGAGLGLAICRHLVELMGSELSVRSTEDEGSSFRFEIELDLASQATVPQVVGERSVAQTEGGATRQPIRLLAVDDSPDNRLLLRALLKRLNVHLSLAENGAQAVDTFRSGKFDLVLMDIHMPVKDGVAATREIRAFERDSGAQPTPIVALTADISKAGDEEARAAGFDRFIFKPVSKDGLRRLLVEQFGDEALALA